MGRPSPSRCVGHPLGHIDVDPVGHRRNAVDYICWVLTVAIGLVFPLLEHDVSCRIGAANGQ